MSRDQLKSNRFIHSLAISLFIGAMTLLAWQSPAQAGPELELSASRPTETTAGPASAPSMAPAPAGLLPVPAATQPASLPQNLLAHGTEELFWVARVSPTHDKPGWQTRIDFRAANVESFGHLTDLPNRVIDLASSGSQLAALLDSGQWLLLSDDPAGAIGAAGQALPGDAVILALANDGETLWAIGTTSSPAAAPATTEPSDVAATTEAGIAAAAPVMAPQTRPTTQPTTRATQIEPPLALYQMQSGRWQRAGGPPVPANVLADANVSLTIVDHTPWLAVYRHSTRLLIGDDGKSILPDNSGDTIEVLRQAPGGWQSVDQFAAPQSRAAFKLLSGLTPATLWLADAKGDRIVQLVPGQASKTAQFKPTTSPATERTAVYAIHAIRELSIVNDNPTEQDYDPHTLRSSSPAAPIALPAPPTPPIYRVLFQLILTLALGFAILSSARRPSNLGEEDDPSRNFVLATLARRALAGVIDLFPFLLPVVLFAQYAQAAGGNPQNPSPAAVRLGMLAAYTGVAAFLVYLIHTAATEALFGRTIGKRIMGLRVVRLDGGTPDSSALLIRNFMRVLDLGLMGIPLVMIVFSPLRQRIGDVAAGTIVILDRAKPEGNLIDPPKEEMTRTEKSAEPPAAAGE